MSEKLARDRSVYGMRGRPVSRSFKPDDAAWAPGGMPEVRINDAIVDRKPSRTSRLSRFSARLILVSMWSMVGVALIASMHFLIMTIWVAIAICARLTVARFFSSTR